MSESTIDKAARLLATGSIERDIAGATVYTSRGDTGNYRTIVGPGIAVCTCRYWRERMLPCSHIDAAIEFENATPEARKLIEACIEQRKARDAKHADEIFDRLTA